MFLFIATPFLIFAPSNTPRCSLQGSYLHLAAITPCWFYLHSRRHGPAAESQVKQFAETLRDESPNKTDPLSTRWRNRSEDRFARTASTAHHQLGHHSGARLEDLSATRHEEGSFKKGGARGRFQGGTAEKEGGRGKHALQRLHGSHSSLTLYISRSHPT